MITSNNQLHYAKDVLGTDSTYFKSSTIAKLAGENIKTEFQQTKYTKNQVMEESERLVSKRLEPKAEISYEQTQVSAAMRAPDRNKFDVDHIRRITD